MIGFLEIGIVVTITAPGQGVVNMTNARKRRPRRHPPYGRDKVTSGGKREESYCQPMAGCDAQSLASIIDWLLSKDRKAGWLNGTTGEMAKQEAVACLTCHPLAPS